MWLATEILAILAYHSLAMQNKCYYESLGETFRTIIKAPKEESGFCYLRDADPEESAESYLLRCMLYILRKYSFDYSPGAYTHGDYCGTKFRVQTLSSYNARSCCHGDPVIPIEFDAAVYTVAEEGDNNPPRVGAYFSYRFREKNLGFFKTLRRRFIDKIKRETKWAAFHKGYTDWNHTLSIGTRYINHPFEKVYFEDVDIFLKKMEQYILCMPDIKNSLKKKEKSSTWYGRPYMHKLFTCDTRLYVYESMPSNYIYQRHQ